MMRFRPLAAVAALAVIIVADTAHALNDGRIRRFATEAQLLALNVQESSLAYALDTNVLYLRAGSSWVAIAGGSGILGTNGGTIGNETDGVWTISEGGEDWTITATSNLWTFASSTGATFTFTPAATFSGDVTLSGAAGAATFSHSDSSIVVPNNDATALDIGGSGLTNLVRLDTSTNLQKLIVTGTTTADAFHVDIGTALFDEGVAAATVATHLMEIRFCGNLSDGATSVFTSFVNTRWTTNYEFSGTGCDGEDSTTETDADEVYHAALAFKPVAMVCVAICTGASAADDLFTFQLRDDTEDVAGMTCGAQLAGDATPAQCTVRDATPATVAAGSTIAMEASGVDDDCNDTGDDFECHVYFTF